MKPFDRINYLIILLSSLMILGCTHDTEYIAGPAGADGIDGIDGHDGLDGVDASAAVCIDCHSASHRDPITTSYILSGHGSGSSWARGKSTSCAQCHNNEGYIDYLSGQFFTTDTSGDQNEFLLDEAGIPILNDNDTPGNPDDDFYEPNPDYNADYGDYLVDGNGGLVPMVNPNGYAVSNPISCTGCHTDHRSFDFENDGNDYALRNIHPVKLVLDPMVSIDFANSTDPLGLSNACITCHQPRPSYPIPTGTEDYEITSSRFGPHHGPQSTMLEGIMGGIIAGSTGYPGVGAATHRSGSSCISCHMGETTDGNDGGHSWKPTLNTCVSCHTTMTSIPEGIAGLDEDMATLKTLLLGLDPSPLLENDRTVPGTYPANVAKAIWNYKTVMEDNSNGIHNPEYTRALIKNSIEALE